MFVTLSGANPTLFSYANRKIEELVAARGLLAKQIADMSTNKIPPAHMTKISGYLENWDSIEFEDKCQVVDRMI